MDFLKLDEQLTEREIHLRDSIRQFGEQRILPIINDYWERAEFPYELLDGLRELGIIGTFIKGYGCPGLSRREAGIVAREMGRIDGSINTFLGVHSNLAMGSIYMLGSEEQRSRWLPAMARLEKTGAFALTEPDHGSDSVSLETSAHLEDGHWVINGHKRWIGNGHAADVVALFARDTADGQVKGFIIEKAHLGTTPQLSPAKSENVPYSKVASSSTTYASLKPTNSTIATLLKTSTESSQPPVGEHPGKPLVTASPAST